jgi:FixJ family two-component response regulator
MKAHQSIGIADVLLKPVGTEPLLDAIERALSRRSRRG